MYSESSPFLPYYIDLANYMKNKEHYCFNQFVDFVVNGQKSPLLEEIITWINKNKSYRIFVYKTSVSQRIEGNLLFSLEVSNVNEVAPTESGLFERVLERIYTENISVCLFSVQ